MLALTPTPLQTAGERALFAELARWDTGGAVRAAVVASLPFSDDGALNRRISDAVLLVPEGVAVVRIVEVVRQTGVVTARPDGAWTIGPGAGPGDVLQLAGGGSTPLDGLMRAGMEAAMRLRRAGLEPGRIARLTVLVGELTSLVPEDGDLGEGDQVAILEPRSLLLGIARASRYAGVDNPRLWTTADVRAALEALGLEGRGPSVEELNGEGFPYSPYVLRRPELLAPAAMTAAATAPPAAVAARPVTATAAAAAPAPSPVVPQPLDIPAPTPERHEVSSVGPSITATAPAFAPPPARPTFPPAPTRDTVAVGGPPEPPVDETGGIGGLFSGGEPADEPPGTPPPPTPPRTAALAAQPAAAPPDAGTPGPARDRRTAVLVAAGVLVVVLLVACGWLLVSRLAGDDDGTAAAPTSAAPASTPSGPQPGATQVVGGATYRLEAVDTQNSCVGHGYDKVGSFFASTSDCVGLSRALYSAQVDGQAMVAAVSRVRMPDATSARALKSLADSNGTGNVSDLLREGVSYAGAPQRLSDSEYASALNGAVVTIVETSWVDPGSAKGSSVLDDAASSGLALALPDPPTT